MLAHNSARKLGKSAQVVAQSLRRNLLHAEQAVQIVRFDLKILSHNRIDDWWRRLSTNEACVAQVRAKAGPGPSTLEGIKRTAEESRLARCGNCGEMASNAFELLMGRGLGQLDFIGVEPFGAWNGNHAFVVIGRAPDSNAYDHTTWGPTAVVCDAWDWQSYPAVDIPQRMSGWSPHTKIFLAIGTNQ